MGRGGGWAIFPKTHLAVHSGVGSEVGGLEAPGQVLFPGEELVHEVRPGHQDPDYYQAGRPEDPIADYDVPVRWRHYQEAREPDLRKIKCL